LIAFNYKKTFRDRASAFVMIQYGRKENLWMCS